MVHSSKELDDSLLECSRFDGFLVDFADTLAKKEQIFY